MIDFEVNKFSPDKTKDALSYKNAKLETFFQVNLDKTLAIGWAHNATSWWYNINPACKTDCGTWEINQTLATPTVDDEEAIEDDDPTSVVDLDENERRVKINGLKIEHEYLLTWYSTNPNSTSDLSTWNKTVKTNALGQIDIIDFAGMTSQNTINMPEPGYTDAYKIEPDFAFTLQDASNLRIMSLRKSDITMEEYSDYVMNNNFPIEESKNKAPILDSNPSLGIYTVCDLSGRMVAKVKELNELKSLNLQLGIYCVMRITNQKVHSFKVVVK